MSSSGGTRAAISSVQYGTATILDTATSATATITAVDTTRSTVLILGAYQGANLGNVTETHYRARVVLTNATTVTASRQGSAYILTVAFVVITWVAPKSVQVGTFTIAALASSGTATITGVDTTRAALFFAGYTIGTNTESAFPDNVGMVLTNATTITATRFGTGDAITIGYAVVEF